MATKGSHVGLVGAADTMELQGLGRSGWLFVGGGLWVPGAPGNSLQLAGSSLPSTQSLSRSQTQTRGMQRLVMEHWNWLGAQVTSGQSLSSSPSPQLSCPLQRKMPGMQRLVLVHLN